MDFDALLVNHIGEFGRYQKCMFTLMLCVSITVAFHTFIHTFTGEEPDSVCMNIKFHNESSISNTNLSLLCCTNQQNTSEKYKRKIHFFEFTETNCSKIENRWENNSIESDVHHTEEHGYDSSKKGSTIVLEWQLVCSRKWLGPFSQSILMAGTLVGSSLLGGLTDRFGRKTILVICTLGNAVFGLASALSLNIWMYSFIRFFVGITMSAQFNAAYILSLELVGPGYRALAAVMILLFHSVGMVLLAVLSYMVSSWRHLHVVIAFPSLVLFVLYVIFVSESPRWLLAHQRNNDALKIMALMAKINNTSIPSYILEDHINESGIKKSLCSSTSTLRLQHISHTPTGDESAEALSLNADDRIIIKQVIINGEGRCYEEKNLNTERKKNVRRCSMSVLSDEKLKGSTALQLIQSTAMLFRTVILTLLWMECSLTYYGLSLHSASLGTNTHMLFFFIGLVEVPAILSYLVLNKRCDRREPVALSLVFSAAVLFSTIFFTPGSVYTIVLFISGKLFISMTFASIYPFATELYPTVLRTAGLGISSLGARAGSLIAPFITLVGDTHSSYPLLVFGACSLLGALCTYLLPETKLYPLPQTVADAEAMHLTAPSWMCLRRRKKSRESDIDV